MTFGRIAFKLVLVLCISVSTSFTNSTMEPPQKNTSDIDARIDSIMANMELIDKVGEMTQLAIDAVSVGEPYNLKVSS